MCKVLLCCWDFFLCCWWHVQRLSVDLRKQWQFHNLICCPRSGFYVLTRVFNGIYRSIGIKDGQLHTWIERDWREDHCPPKISLQLSSGARGTNLALNIPDQAFVLGTSPKFALPGRYGDTGRSSNTKDGCEAVLCQLRCKVGETHDIDTVFKHCVQTLGVRHADSWLKECPGCDLELLGTDSTSNNMSWVSRYIYIYDYTDIERYIYILWEVSRFNPFLLNLWDVHRANTGVC